MTLATSDVSSLTQSLSRWEYGEYTACAFVALACAGEYIADFTNWLTGGDEGRKKRLAKRSTLLLIVSLAVELLCLAQTNNISGRLIGSLSDKATDADTKAQSALEKSGTADTKAGEALTESTAATEAAGKAQQKAAAARDTAERAEGDAEHVGAKADAISARLDTTLQQLSHVEERVSVQGPRSVLLINGESAFVKALKPFEGQKVIFVTCSPRQTQSQSNEEYEFELTLLNRLTEPRPGSVPGAGWKTYSEGHDSWYPCKASGWAHGVWVMYSAPSAKPAAEALGIALNKLKISTETTWFNPKDANEYARQKRQPNDFNALWEKVAREPTAVYVLTGEHP